LSDKKNDLTRIEDLSELLHSEDEEDFNDIDSFSSHADDDTPDEDLEKFSTGFADDKTDPDISIEGLNTAEDTDDQSENSDTSFGDTNFGENEFNDNQFSDSGFGNSEFSEGEFSDSDFNDNELSSDEFESSEFSSDFSSEAENPVEASDESLGESLGESINRESTIDLTNEDLHDEINNKNLVDFEDNPTLNEEPTLKTSLNTETNQNLEKITSTNPLQEIKTFANNISYGDSTSEGNPPYSVIVKSVKYEEDAAAIIDHLIEYGLAKEQDKPNLEKSLRLGSLLIPRISEFAAIFIAHKLRAYDVEIALGLSDDIQPPKSYKSEDKGLVSKRNIFQNRVESHIFKKSSIQINDVILTTSTQLEGYQIRKYLGMATESVVIDLALFNQQGERADASPSELTEQIDRVIKENTVINHPEENINSANLAIVYQQLALKLRPTALKLNANAIIGINYNLLPIPDESTTHGKSYHLVCTGNVVWVENIS
jgi:uncharacterized protein YbjQ (UPF0145 family)